MVVARQRARDEGARLRALVVDDEAPALAELRWLLEQDARVGQVCAAGSSEQALRLLDTVPFDVVFCDIRMPGLDGLGLARVLARFSERPQVVFVTAYDRHAIDAFEVRATDYLLKPVRPERLGEAVRRVLDAAGSRDATPADDDETIAVELGGVTRFVHRSEVTYVIAHGDYVRLYTAAESHLLRVPLTTLEQRWAAAGFVRIHRSALVALGAVDELRSDEGRCSVRIGERVLAVSRRHTRELRDRLVRAATPGRDPSRDPGREQSGREQSRGRERAT
ncbi:LytTR family DNA-binding domain-containing protein [Frankia sp. R43]|uniref:LytR/AlgR family response regulator transcription factor n=1 Tax=Frankia sp. R43 TaxID=269536 RepID=UPI000B12C3D9|nr:LytTR family DNA-binding domain-containing protein [Frankia sp. R43]